MQRGLPVGADGVRAAARPDYAEVRGQDEKGNPVRVRGTGYFARCLQHETDHLYGYLYIDRLSKRDRKDALRQMAENDAALRDRSERERLRGRRGGLRPPFGRSSGGQRPSDRLCVMAARV